MHQAVLSAEPLTPQQTARFAAQGFLAVSEPQISRSEIAWCRNILMRLIERGEGRADGRNFDLIASSDDRETPRKVTSPQILKPSLYAKELENFSFRRVGLAMARQLLGPDATFVGDTVIFKPSQFGGPTPWHQDEAFREPNFDYQEISIWIALTNTTLENGPMAYVPGSHLGGILPHRLYGGSSESNSIECCAGFDEKSAVVCPVPAGALIIHHCRTVHGATANKTNLDRLAYVLSFSTPLELRKEFRTFPWLQNLRKSLHQERKRTLIRGGVIKEMVRVASSDRFSVRHIMSMFAMRRINQLRLLFRRK